jgi:hypothetical protein
MRYDEAVAEAARCLSRGEEADWRLAQLTYEHTRRQRGNHADDGRVTMERWCADVQGASSVRTRFGEATGSRYARIWGTYGIASPATQWPSFKDAYAEVDGTPDRERMMAYEAKRLLEQGTPEQKEEAAAALLEDPAIQQRAVHYLASPVGRAVTKITTKRNAAAEATARERAGRIPQVAVVDQARALADLIHATSGFADDLHRLLGEMGRLPNPDRDAWMSNRYLADAVARAEVALESLRSLLKTGIPRADVDDFVKGVLGQKGGGGAR